MAQQNNKGSGAKRSDGNRTEPIGSCGPSIERNLANALEEVSAHTGRIAPAEDLEARLLARAKSEGLLGPTVSASSFRSASPRSASASAHDILGRWVWAPLAVSVAILLAWVGYGWWQDVRSIPEPAPQQAATTVNPAPAGDRSSPPESPAVLARPESAMQQPAPAANVQRASRNQPRPRRHSVARLPAQEPAPASVAVTGPEMANPKELLSVAAATEVAESARYSQFVPLDSAPGIRSDEFLQTVRVRVGADDFWRLGLPVSPIRRDPSLGHVDRVMADFLVGEDGRPRAVRLVSLNE